MSIKLTPKDARMATGMGRAELATKASVGYTTVCRLEQMEEWPTRTSMRQRYLAALGLTEADVTEARVTSHRPIRRRGKRAPVGTGR